MNSTAQRDFGPRPLPVLWLDAPADRLLISLSPLNLICRRKLRRVAGTPRGGVRQSAQRADPADGVRGRRAFTLLEMMVVIAIIGFMAALALPHVVGFSRANSMTAATRQLLDDCALARRRAIINRSTVYMVFVPPSLWSNQTVLQEIYGNQISNLVTHQFAAYALVSLGSVGDQPGRHYAQYLTDWRILPDGVFFAPFEFTNSVWPLYVYTTNTLIAPPNNRVQNSLQPWASVTVPFPSLYYPNTNMPLPCIGFSPAGSLTTPLLNQYIALARGSVIYAQGSNGAPLLQPAIWGESPPGNDVNNANLIQIDWATARARVVQNQLQ
jgi:prepilin-type N-terminal cleavage/methylation domain-containing protein